MLYTRWGGYLIEIRCINKSYRGKMLPRFDHELGARHYDILFCHSRVIAQGWVNQGNL